MAKHQMPNMVYSKLPEAVQIDTKHLLGSEVSNDEAHGKQIIKFLSQRLPLKKDIDHTIENLTDNGKAYFHMQSFHRVKKKQFNFKRRCKGKLTSKEKKQLGLFKLPQEQKYESFIALHELWKDYICNLIDFRLITEENKATVAQQKLLKADYHGALVTVSKSKTSSLVGQTGIVVQEMKNVFKIVTRDDKLKIIPKENSVFTLELDGYVFNIQGSQFRYTAAERIHRKFKFKPRSENDLDTL